MVSATWVCRLSDGTGDGVNPVAYLVIPIGTTHHFLFSAFHDTAHHGHCEGRDDRQSQFLRLACRASAPSQKWHWQTSACLSTGRSSCWYAWISSICVATITGFIFSRQTRMIRFWATGVLATSISTPKITSGHHDAISIFDDVF